MNVKRDTGVSWPALLSRNSLAGPQAPFHHMSRMLLPIENWTTESSLPEESQVAFRWDAQVRRHEARRVCA